jgi:hypothetical protein
MTGPAVLTVRLWPRTIPRMAEVSPIIYREEVLTLMGVVGDIRQELRRIRRALEDDDEEEEETEEEP